MNTFDIGELRRMVSYDPSTGFMVWRVRMSNRVKIGMPAFAASKTSGHLHGLIHGTQLQAHRVAWAIHYGHWPKGCIDHINGVRNDNSISNLRVVSKRENALNRRENGGKKSGLPHGVSVKENGRYFSQIQIDKKNIHLGYFSTPSDAAAAYQKAKVELGFHENHGLRAYASQLPAASSQEGAASDGV